MKFDKTKFTTVEEVEKRVAELKDVVERSSDVSEIETCTEELTLLQERANELKEIEERKAAVRNIETGTAETQVVERGAAMPNTQVEFNASSAEYRSAWLKRMAVNKDGVALLGELTEREERAFIHTTANTGAVVPTTTLDMIIDRVKAEAPMLDDAEITSMTEGFAIPVRKTIKAGDAAVVAEGTANADEEDEFVLITMPGLDISKNATMTRRMKFMSIDSFESWLVADIAKRIAVAKEKALIARLDGTAPASGISVNNDVKIDAGNVLTDQPYTDAAIRAIMAKIDENGQVVVYANRNTIYNGFAGIETGDSKKAFIESAMVDPIIKGVMYGAVIKVDANLADNVAYFGVQGSLKGNTFAPLEIFPTVEAKTANTIFTGTEVFDGGLANPKAFVKATFSGGASK